MALLFVAVLLPPLQTGCRRDSTAPPPAPAPSETSSDQPTTRTVNQKNTPDDTTGPAAGYVGRSACAECHEDIDRSYQTVAMARSFYKPTPENIIEDYTDNNHYYHAKSDRHYEMIRRGDEFFQRRYQLDEDGNRVREFEQRIDFIMGSGNNVRAYLHQHDDGRLTLLPVNWYAEKSEWAMFPGYDNAHHPGFLREATYSCMFCHNATPNLPPGADLRDEAHYPADLPLGIDCERCHGPGANHVTVARDEQSTLRAVRDSIVNPARLPNDLAMDICLQCHLETTVTTGVPHTLRRLDHGQYAFRPGQRLSDYMIPIDFADPEHQQDHLEIVHHGYRLMQSKCFTESNGAMTCTTCHDPHHTPPSPQLVQQIDAKCLGCHEMSDCELSRMETDTAFAADQCTTCHMPKRRTWDVVHAVMTDHYIRKTPLTGDPLAELAENYEPYKGRLKFYDPEQAPAGPEGDMYLGIAHLTQDADIDYGFNLLERALAEHQPATAYPLIEMALAYEKQGNPDKAVAWLERARQMEPDRAEIYVNLGSIFAAASQPAAALQQYEIAAQRDPDNAEILFNRGDALAALGRIDDARQAYEKAISMDPLMVQARNNLAGLLIQSADLDAAAQQLNEALRVDPGADLAWATLGMVHANRADWPAAQTCLEHAIQQTRDPNRRAAFEATLSQIRALSGISRP